MKRLSYTYIYAALAIVLMFQGCGMYDELTYYGYDIKIINDTRYSFSVYLDGVFQFTLDSGSSATIEDVEEGYHNIEAKIWGITGASRTINLTQDLEWTVSE